MNKTKAILKYKTNFFEIIKNGDYVVCAVSKKEIPLEKLSYWNVDLQEAYFSAVEAKKKFEEIKNNN